MMYTVQMMHVSDRTSLLFIDIIFIDNDCFLT